MITATSQTISQAQVAERIPNTFKSFSFTIPSDTDGHIKISDELLDTHSAAQERAVSEFLDNAYRLKVVRFTTYLTDLYLNQEINIQGLWYKIKSISPEFNAIYGQVVVEAHRYE